MFVPCLRVATSPFSLAAMVKLVGKMAILGAASCLFTGCGEISSGSGNMAGPTVVERDAKIASEPTGDFFYGRRYHVEKTRFWGYVRQPRQPWSRAKLVLLREDKKLAPDRLPENGPPGQRYAFDNNTDYLLRGYYTGTTSLEPNSNQFLPVFMLTGYQVLDRQPGWLFRPDDRYDPYRITLTPR